MVNINRVNFLIIQFNIYSFIIQSSTPLQDIWHLMWKLLTIYQYTGPDKWWCQWSFYQYWYLVSLAVALMSIICVCVWNITYNFITETILYMKFCKTETEIQFKNELKINIKIKQQCLDSISYLEYAWKTYYTHYLF